MPVSGGGRSGSGPESSLSWGSSRGILVVFFEGRDPQMCTFGLSGCCVKPRELQTCPGASHKFHEKTPRKGKKCKLWRENEKERNFGRSGEGVVGRGGVVGVRVVTTLAKRKNWLKTLKN